MLANETVITTCYDSVFFLYVQLVFVLAGHIVQANFVQFDDDFTGLVAEAGMLFQ